MRGIALQVAQENATKLGARVDFLRTDLLAGIRHNSMDMVVSNPPYIPLHEKDALAKEVRDHEPHLALFGGEDGLDIYRLLIAQAAVVLKPGGQLLMELAYNGAASVQALLDQSWTAQEVVPDLAGHQRVLIATKSLSDPAPHPKP